MTRAEKNRARIASAVAFDLQRSDHGRAICGMDEAGRGPLAGPVYAACVALPLQEEQWILSVNDSKKLSPQTREKAAELIRQTAYAYGIGIATVEEIEQYNILEATRLAMRRAYEQMGKQAYLLIDAVDPQTIGLMGEGIVKGDSLSYHIGAASILAKTARDAEMQRLGEKYPAYGFCENKGYGTAAHIQALKEFGPCAAHRASFLKKILGEEP